MTTDGAPLIETRIDGGVVLLTLNRPSARNALDTGLRHALADKLDALREDETCRVVVLTGAEGTFCAGFDLKELAHSEAPAELFAEAATYHKAVHEFPKPLIAAISGAAVAGGLDLALMCDLRFADPTARLGQPQVKMGVPAAFDLIRSVVAEPVARELCLTGRIVDAAEAQQLGLVIRVVDDCLTSALEMASNITEIAAAEDMKRAFLSAQADLF